MPDLSTRNARKKLRARSAPYWQRIAKGRALGYSATKGSKNSGRWQARVHAGGTTSGYRFHALGAADDLPHIPADGETILDYAQALDAARRWDPWDDDPEEEPVTDDGDEEEAQFEKGTVGYVVQQYLAWYKEHKRSYQRTRYQAKAHILDTKLAEVPLDKLNVSRLRRWQANVAAKDARVRTKPGKKQRHREERDERARRASANRVWTILRAALNKAWEDGTIKGDPVWRRVKPYKDTDQARTRWLDGEEVGRLLNACDGDPAFRDLVTAALATGMRYGELCRLRVDDVDPNAGAVRVVQSKAGKPRYVFLSDEGAAFFEALAAGRDGVEPLLRRNGRAWKATEQTRPMSAALKAAKIKGASFHTLRHSYASMYLMSGGGLADLAKQLGHADTRMVERVYGHLDEQWRAERARQFAPALGVEPGKVRPMKKKKRARR